jgi:3',5'-cyclic AMP phosphodiesterase CpdA
MAGISTNKKNRVQASSSTTPDRSQGMDTVTLMHVSDLHLACTEKVPPGLLMNKRILGYLRWKIRRGREYEPTLLEAIRKQFQNVQPDQIVITGDLTHLGLPEEFKKVSLWLEGLAPPEKITVIPGNHDTYVPSPWEDSFSRLEKYMLPRSCYKGKLPPPSLESLFPTLCVTGRIAIIGISTARPCAWHLATGTAGKSQLDRLASALKKTAGAGLFRVLALHHPPAPGIVDPRKELTDAPELLKIIEKHGCELILHGHSHRTSIYSVPGPRGQIPVIEAPSALSISDMKVRRARIFTYEVKRHGNMAWKCLMRQMILAPHGGKFIEEGCREFDLGA